MNISDKIKLRREQLGLTLQDVADHIKVSRPTVQRYESGEIKKIKLETVQSLAVILKVSPGWLMGWEDDLNETPSKFHIRLMKLREKSGLTQEEFAAKIGASIEAVMQYEDGDREPSFNVLEKIADIFDVSVDYLIRGSLLPKNQVLPEDMKLILEAGTELNDVDRERFIRMVKAYLGRE